MGLIRKYFRTHKKKLTVDIEKQAKLNLFCGINKTPILIHTVIYQATVHNSSSNTDVNY